MLKSLNVARLVKAIVSLEAFIRMLLWPFITVWHLLLQGHFILLALILFIGLWVLMWLMQTWLRTLIACALATYLVLALPLLVFIGLTEGTIGCPFLWQKVDETTHRCVTILK